MAVRKLAQPKTVDVVKIESNKGSVGKAFKKEAKEIMEFLAQMQPEVVQTLETALKTTEQYDLCIGDATFKLTSEMVQVKRYQENVHVEEFVPNVIEPSFGIGRIMYAIFEHNFRVRSDDEQKTVDLFFFVFHIVYLNWFHFSLRSIF